METDTTKKRKHADASASESAPNKRLSAGKSEAWPGMLGDLSLFFSLGLPMIGSADESDVYDAHNTPGGSPGLLFGPLFGRYSRNVSTESKGFI